MSAEPAVAGDNTPPGFREWEQEGEQLVLDLRQAEAQTSSLQFSMGDWYNRGEATFGEVASQGIPESQYARKTILNCARIARRVPEHRRREELSFGHHDAVAGLDDEDAQDRWLTWAIEHEATVAELRDAIRQERQGEGGGEGPGGGGDDQEVRLETEDGAHGEVHVYEITFDLDTGEDERTHVATFFANDREVNGTPAPQWYAGLLQDAWRRAKR